MSSWGDSHYMGTGRLVQLSPHIFLGRKKQECFLVAHSVQLTVALLRLQWKLWLGKRSSEREKELRDAHPGQWSAALTGSGWTGPARFPCSGCGMSSLVSFVAVTSSAQSGSLLSIVLATREGALLGVISLAAHFLMALIWRPRDFFWSWAIKRLFYLTNQRALWQYGLI